LYAVLTVCRYASVVCAIAIHSSVHISHFDTLSKWHTVLSSGVHYPVHLLLRFSDILCWGHLQIMEDERFAVYHCDSIS